EAALTASLTSAEHPNGLTPAQEAQLRATIASDQRVLGQLNEDAQNGHLRRFDLAAPRSQNLLGTYDKGNGSVTLPADSFNQGANLNATLRVQDMSMKFAHGTTTNAGVTQQPVTQAMVNNLQHTLNGSPVLAGQIRSAVAGEDPSLAHFAPLGPAVVAGGTYDGNTRTMNLPLTNLSTRFNERALTFVLGHETQHALDRAQLTGAYQTFGNEIERIARDTPLPHDYTVPMRQILAAHRVSEASAQIAGWNALLSREQQLKPDAGLNDMLKIGRERLDGTRRVFDFIDPNSPRDQVQRLPGIAFNPDATLTPTPDNIAAEGRYYFDKPPEKTGIGFHGDSDYPNFFGAALIGHVIDAERRHVNPGPDGTRPPVVLDMNDLHLRENLMERDGIRITNRPNERQPYVDSGEQLPAPPRYFDNTDTPPGTPHSHEYVPVQPEGATRGMSGGAARNIDQGQNAPAGAYRPPSAQDIPSPTQNLNGFLDRMIAASQPGGDQAAFRQMTQMLTSLPPAQELHAQTIAAVDRFEAQQLQLQQQENQTRQGPAL
ncbi:MAG: hypothetical protein FWG56_00325, partial [Desulfovibrionaceae bacterium]|nr:hypothetical protein [Desulfovibrionaceae bacterium]